MFARGVARYPVSDKASKERASNANTATFKKPIFAVPIELKFIFAVRAPRETAFMVRMFARLETFRVRTFPDVVAKDEVFRVRMFARLETFRVRTFAWLETFRVWTAPDVVAKDTVFKVRMFARLETFRVWTFADAAPRLRMFEEVAFIVVA